MVLGAEIQVCYHFNMIKKIVFALALWINIFSAPGITLAAPTIEINFNKFEYFSNEMVDVLFKTSGIDIGSYPIDLYADNTKYQVLLKSEINIGTDFQPPYGLPISSFESLDLSNYSIFKETGTEYFNIFLCRSGTKCSLQDRSLRKNILGATNIHILTPTGKKPIANLKINGQDTPSPIFLGDKILVTWNSSNTSSCSGGGNYLPDTEGGTWPTISPRDKKTVDGLAPYYSNLPTFGQVSLFMRPTVDAQEVTIGIQCTASDVRYLDAKDEITININEGSSSSSIKLLPLKNEGKWKLNKKQNIKWTVKKPEGELQVNLLSLEDNTSCIIGNALVKKKNLHFTPKKDYKCKNGNTLVSGSYTVQLIKNYNVISQSDQVVTIK